MAGAAQCVAVLLAVYLHHCSCLPRLDEYVEEVDKCPFNSHQPLYSEVADTASTVLHPDYVFLYNFLFMRLENERTEVRYKNIKASLERSPINIFGNLSLSRCRYDDYYGCDPDIPEDERPYNYEPKLGELISEKVFSAYTHFISTSSRVTPTDLNQIGHFSFDKYKWTTPWLQENLVSALLYTASSLEDLQSKDKQDTGTVAKEKRRKTLLQSKNIDNILQVIGELANNVFHSSVNLNNLNILKSGILRELESLKRKLTKDNIDTAVDCWYSTDGFYHIEEGAEENNLLLQGMVEVVPKAEVKKILESLNKYNRNDLEVEIDKILVVVDQKIQEIDVSRMINLVSDFATELLESMLAENVSGKNLFQRVQKLHQMIEKAMWRIRSGLWPEMINLMDRIVLTMKNTDKAGDDKVEFWNELDSLLSPTYHELRRQYEAVLMRELFPTSKTQLGETQFSNIYLRRLHGELKPALYRYFHGQLKPALYNVFANSQYNVTSEVLRYVRNMEVVEWEWWLVGDVFYIFIRQGRDLLRHGKDSQAHWPLKWPLFVLNSGGFSDLFFQNWEKSPRDLEDFLEMDSEAYFMYFLHAFITT
eukprot:GFUD01014989.1.p1 GENE.GFUD01014989.1~~GFUD01014989.1.p1  ORF type:complete len:592 (+),score=109.46 GFUD01014989.1:3-1778(+)